jgi:hypothetical protein
MRVCARCVLPAVSGLIAVVACLGAVLPVSAAAEATAGAPPVFSSIAGLPDGRVYELASPANKYGNSVLTFLGEGTGLARADGNAVMYFGDGALAEQSGSGNDFGLFVSQRGLGGWSTRSATPPPAKGIDAPEENSGFFTLLPKILLPAADLSHLAFTTNSNAAFAPPPDRLGLATNFYLAGPNPLVEAPAWVAQPQIAEPVEPSGNTANNFIVPVGGSSDLSTLYFTYSGTLLAEDAAREVGSPGLYEYRDGVLSVVGVLPDGSVSPSGAVPAVVGNLQPNPDQVDNVVSVDGSRVFFIAADPGGAGQELFARETMSDGTKRTVLVSRSQLPGHVGEAAPHGPLLFRNTAPGAGEYPNYGYADWESNSSYVYASPDGSRAFFESVDRLTSDAPSDEAAKVYVFDLATGSLAYLPGVVGSPVAVARDGSSLIFENTASSPFELERWSAGPNGGSVRAIVKLPASLRHMCPLVCVGPTRLSDDGGVVVFETNSPIAGFNDGGFGQVFRYDGVADALSCLSCPPPGVAPSGDAFQSIIDQTMDRRYQSDPINQTGPGDRGVSADGGRVFFDSPDALVPQDVNGRRDVYEWEDGTVFLISAGTSSQDSLFIDNGETGDDIFFSTASGIASGDTDGGYDVYDARVPRPGDNPPPSSVPCQGDVCQGPPSVPELLGAPASATFNGLGNLPALAEGQPVVKAKAKVKARKKKKLKRRHGKRSAKRGRGAVRASGSSGSAVSGEGRGE